MDLETEKQLTEARRLYDRSDFKECIDAVKGMKADKRTVELIGRSYMMLSDIKKGKQVFEEALKNVKSDQIDSTDMINLMLFITQMNYESQFYLKTSILPVLKNNYDCYMKNNQEQDPQRKKGILLWAKGAAIFIREVGDYKKSTELLKESIKYLKEYHQDILILTSFIYFSANKIQEAVDITNQVILLNEQNFEAFANQGYFLAQLKDYEGSMKFYKKAEILCPNNEVNLCNISILLENYQDNNLTSEMYAKKIINIKPQSSQGYIRLAKLKLINKEENSAIQILQQALPLCTDFGIAQELFLIYQQKQMNKEYQQLIQTSILQFPENKGESLLIFADFLLEQQEYEEAQTQLRKSLLVPSTVFSYSSYIRLAFCDFALQNPMGVIENAKQCLNHPSAQFILQEDILSFVFVLRESKINSFKDLKFFFEYFQDHPKYLPLLANDQELLWFPNIFKAGLDIFRQQLQVMVFNEIISDQLLFKPQATLWDLYID